MTTSGEPLEERLHFVKHKGQAIYVIDFSHCSPKEMLVLLDLVRAAAPRDGRLAVAEAVRAEVAARGLPGPNIDFALAVLTRVAGMPDGAGEAIFAVGRTAGWIAHAIEEYARATPLRPRAVYTGPGPGQGS